MHSSLGSSHDVCRAYSAHVEVFSTTKRSCGVTGGDDDAVPDPLRGPQPIELAAALQISTLRYDKFLYQDLPY